MEASQRPRGVWWKDDAPTPSREEKKQETAADDTNCVECGSLLTRDDIGLYKKLVNRGAHSSFLCKGCLAKHFQMTAEDCDRLIKNFKEDGCSLFF